MERKYELMLRKHARSRFPHSDATIVIEIPAAKDPELLNTVHSALVQADVPGRVHFSVCYQDDDMDTLIRLKGVPNMRIAYVPPDQARGTCYARWHCQKLYDGEDFTLAVDSHMRFLKHWDTMLLDQWHACGDPRAVISFYPAALKVEWLPLKLDDAVFDGPRPGGRMVMPRFHDHGTYQRAVFYPCMYERRDNLGARIRDRTPFFAGCYSFGPGSRDIDVPVDPDMYWYGDEFAIAVRLYTHGYNIYTSDFCWVLHWYERGMLFVPKKGCGLAKEFARFNALVGLPVEEPVDFGQYGLGTVRTVDDYQVFSGVNFAEHSVSDRTATGRYGFDPIF